MTRGKAKLSQAEVRSRFLAKRLELLGTYEHSLIPVLVRCLDCGFEYKKTANSLRCGCKKCGGTNKLSQKDVEDRFKKMGIEFLGQYVNNRVRVPCRCTICGCEWKPFPDRAFVKGCPDCSDRRGFEKLRLPVEEIQRRFNAAGLEMVGKYENVTTPVLSRCISCGHIWHAWPYNVAKGSGCPHCKPFGFRQSSPAILYYIKISNGDAPPIYKIGVTTGTVRKRYGSEFIRIEVLSTKAFPTGIAAYLEEQSIIKTHEAHAYKGPRVFEFTGTTEMFVSDVLGAEKTLRPSAR